MKVYGVLVSYYPDYAEHALLNFNEILRKIDSNYDYIIACSCRSPLAGHSKSIIYSNKNWEFSGFYEGYLALQKTYKLDNSSIVIFANDTFCKHRIFSYIDRMAFISGVKKTQCIPESYIVGEKCSLKKVVSLLDLKGKYWVSTYLFAMNVKSINKVMPFFYREDEYRLLIRDMNENSVEFTPAANSWFSDYINNWLYPKKVGKGWRNSNVSLEIKEGKLKAILNEMRLTFIISSNGGEVIDTYVGIFSYYRLWRTRIEKLLNRFIKPYA